MKVLGLREAKQSLSMCIDKAQKDRVLITKHGKPAASEPRRPRALRSGDASSRASDAPAHHTSPCACATRRSPRSAPRWPW